MSATVDQLFSVLVKDGEYYIYVYPDTQRGKRQAIAAIGRHAANADLSLSWQDATRLACRINDIERDDVPRFGRRLHIEEPEAMEPAPAWLGWLLIGGGAAFWCAACCGVCWAAGAVWRWL